MTEQILFQKLTYIDKLVRAGISEDQARAHADAMEEALRESVATRHDMTLLRADISALEYRLTVRGGVALAAAVAILASIKFFG
jgi:hypothetical protein